jgi:hypothetical protein
VGIVVLLLCDCWVGRSFRWEVRRCEGPLQSAGVGCGVCTAMGMQYAGSRQAIVCRIDATLGATVSESRSVPHKSEV